MEHRVGVPADAPLRDSTLAEDYANGRKNAEKITIAHSGLEWRHERINETLCSIYEGGAFRATITKSFLEDEDALSRMRQQEPEAGHSRGAREGGGDAEKISVIYGQVFWPPGEAEPARVCASYALSSQDGEARIANASFKEFEDIYEQIPGDELEALVLGGVASGDLQLEVVHGGSIGANAQSRQLERLDELRVPLRAFVFYMLHAIIAFPPSHMLSNHASVIRRCTQQFDENAAKPTIVESETQDNKQKQVKGALPPSGRQATVRPPNVTANKSSNSVTSRTTPSENVFMPQRGKCVFGQALRDICTVVRRGWVMRDWFSYWIKYHYVLGVMMGPSKNTMSPVAIKFSFFVQKKTPLSFYELLESNNPLQGVWREVYLAKRCAAFYLCGVTRSFTLQSYPTAYVYTEDESQYETEPMRARYRQSAVAAAAVRRIGEARGAIADEAHNRVFARLDRRTHEALSFAERHLLLSRFSLLQHMPYDGDPFIDVMEFYLSIEEKRDRHINAERFLFELAYGCHALHARAHAIHGDLHLNNFVCRFEPRDEGLIVDKSMLFILDSKSGIPGAEDAYLVPINPRDCFIVPVIIDFSRAVLGPDTRAELRERLAPEQIELFYREQVETAMQTLHRFAPVYVEENRERLKTAVALRFPEFYAALSCVDFLAGGRNIASFFEKRGRPDLAAPGRRLEKAAERTLFERLDALVGEGAGTPFSGEARNGGREYSGGASSSTSPKKTSPGSSSKKASSSSLKKASSSSESSGAAKKKRAASAAGETASGSASKSKTASGPAAHLLVSHEWSTRKGDASGRKDDAGASAAAEGQDHFSSRDRDTENGLLRPGAETDEPAADGRKAAASSFASAPSRAIADLNLPGAALIKEVFPQYAYARQRAKGRYISRVYRIDAPMRPVPGSASKKTQGIKVSRAGEAAFRADLERTRRLMARAPGVGRSSQPMARSLT